MVLIFIALLLSLPMDSMFSGAYLNSFSVSVIPSERTAQSMWSNMLCAFSPEVGSRVVIRKVQFFFFTKIVAGPSPNNKKRDCVSGL